MMNRFLDKILFSETCWEWTASKDSRGYGWFYSGGSVKKAHRVSYELFVADIPTGLCVCHRCDNPSCVRPDHLFVGSQADNMTDKVVKGRQSRSRTLGEKHGLSKLTEVEVRQIRGSQLGARQLAAQFGVSRGTIHDIRAGRTWSWLEEE